MDSELENAFKTGNLEEIKKWVNKENVNTYFRDTDWCDSDMTPLYFAAKYGHIHLAEYFLEIGGDLDIVEYRGENSLLFFATMYKKYDFANWLIQQGVKITDYWSEENTTFLSSFREKEGMIIQFVPDGKSKVKGISGK